MKNLVRKTLQGGPCDGQVITIHKDNLKIKPIISTVGKDGKHYDYALDERDEFVWLRDPDDPKFARKWFVCDDDGNVIAEEDDEEDALRKLDEFNDDAGKRKSD